MAAPCIIEVALNGATTKDVNSRVPRTPEEITADALACIEVGATIVHNHNDEFLWAEGGVHAAAPYLAAWGLILEARDDRTGPARPTRRCTITFAQLRASRSEAAIARRRGEDAVRQVAPRRGDEAVWQVAPALLPGMERDSARLPRALATAHCESRAGRRRAGCGSSGYICVRMRAAELRTRDHVHARRVEGSV